MIENVIRPADAGDAPALAQSYTHDIRETVVTFEEIEVSLDEMGRRLVTWQRLLSAAGETPRGGSCGGTASTACT